MLPSDARETKGADVVEFGIMTLGTGQANAWLICGGPAS